MRDRERERQRHKQREEQAPCREADVGLDPRSPGSHPGPKGDTQTAEPPRHPNLKIFNESLLLSILQQKSLG